MGEEDVPQLVGAQIQGLEQRERAEHLRERLEAIMVQVQPAEDRCQVGHLGR